MQLRWVLEASEHYTGNHGIYGPADRNFGADPSIIRDLNELRVEMVR